MNLTPQWVQFFRNAGVTAVHWVQVGSPQATDYEIMEWARTNAFIVFTHDLDFGALLATTQVGEPSVIQLRAQDVLPTHLGSMVLQTLQRYEAELQAGALITIDEARARIRILPLNR
jgi:predicted nuclease of predicted toxin-antitoxin system